MTQPISRRAVLRGLAIGATAPAWIRFAEPAAAAASAPAANTSRRLLVVFLRGGNDALRTVAPIGYDALTKLRPNVGLRATDTVALGNGYGLHRALPSFFEQWRAGQLAIIQQTGPVVADFSHSTASRKVESGNPDDRYASGWLGRYLDTTPAAGPVRAVAFGDSLPLTLVGRNSDALSMPSLSAFRFYDRTYRDVAARRNALARMTNVAAPAGRVLETMVHSQRELLGGAAPLTALAGTLVGKPPSNAESIVEVFTANLGTEIGFLSAPGFDTHTDERSRQGAALENLDDVISTFWQSAAATGIAANSAVLVVSEFGRRVEENKSGGTDHGYGTTAFLMGPGVRGGMYGPQLDVSQLQDGNLPVRVDIRSVYASVLGGWLRTNPSPILGGDFGALPLFR
jgi:uncharacterized protein (DUF1501 family)